MPPLNPEPAAQNPEQNRTVQESEKPWAPLLQDISALSNKTRNLNQDPQEQDKITSWNRFRPPTPDEDTNKEEYQTDETNSSDNSLQTRIRKYQEERMATAAAARQNQNQNAPGPKEIRINLQKEFSGSQSEAEPFLQDVTLYLTLNQEIYNNDNKKIIFTLFFMNSGLAQAWKKSFITQKTDANGNMNLGTWVACKQALENAFLISDIPGNARARLWTLK